LPCKGFIDRSGCGLDGSKVLHVAQDRLNHVVGSGADLIGQEELQWLFSIRRGAVFSGDPPIGIHH